MKKFFKFFFYFLGALIVLTIVFIIYFNATYPRVDPPTNEKVEITPARLERGKYLAHHVTVCMDCHSTRDWSKFAGPVMEKTYGKGGEKFDEQTAGVPGILYAKNITPAGIGNLTDGELIRTITCGVTKDGKTLFPLMPYFGYNNLSKEDLYSIVAYIRSLQPIQNNVEESSVNFPVNLIIKTAPPKSFKAAPEPNKNNLVECGKYLVTIASCGDCHTQMEKGKPIEGKEFAGGFQFQLPGGLVRSANITPDKTTGIGAWTKDDFIARFKSFDPVSNPPMSVEVSEFNTPMPWTLFAGMTNEDLGAVYEYLRTIKPVANNVVKFTPNK
jgi:mono/diheme cytochrome c family protein